jgi:hypothetical protein
MKKFHWKKHGFSKRKPKEPGVYFIIIDLPPEPDSIWSHNPTHIRERWDVAEIHFHAGSYFNVYENKEEFAHWNIKTLNGLDYNWRKGMWIKGPINPFI